MTVLESNFPIYQDLNNDYFLFNLPQEPIFIKILSKNVIFTYEFTYEPICPKRIHYKFHNIIIFYLLFLPKLELENVEYFENLSKLFKLFGNQQDLFIFIQQNNQNFGNNPNIYRDFSIKLKNQILFKNLKDFQENFQKALLNFNFSNKASKYLKGKHLMISIVEYNPNAFKIAQNQEKYEGFSLDFFQNIGTFYNFTRKNSYVKEFGIKVDGVWKGAIGELIVNRADVAIIIAYSDSRYPFIDFTTRILDTGVTFTSNLPKIFINSKALIQPLSIDVWITCAILFILVVFILFMFIKTLDKKEPITSIALLISYSIILEQSTNINDLLKSGKLIWKVRIFLSIWIIFSILMCTAYKSKLLAFMAFPNFEKIPRSFKELAQNLDYKINYPLDGGAMFLYFNSTNAPAHIIAIRKRLHLYKVGKI